MNPLRILVYVIWFVTFLVLYRQVAEKRSAIAISVLPIKDVTNQDQGLLIKVMVEQAQLQGDVRVLAWIGLFLFAGYYFALSFTKKIAWVALVAHVISVFWCWQVGFKRF